MSSHEYAEAADGAEGSERGRSGRRGRRWKIGAAVAAVPGLLALYTGVSSLTGYEETYSRVRAAGFVDSYFDGVLADPADARRTLTTDQFRELRVVAEPGYTDFWDGVRSVDVHSVRRTDAKNWFEVDHTLTYEDGLTQHVVSEWRVTCASRFVAYLPFWDCSSAGLLLDDFSSPPG